MENSSYSVEDILVDSAYEFIGWSGGNPSGVLTEDINLDAVVTDSAYKFIGWKGDLVSTNSSEIVTMTSDKTVTAVFELIPVPTEEPDEVIPQEPVIEALILDSTTDILEESVAQELAVTELPQTGGVNLGSLVLFGAIITSIGFVIRRK